MVTSSLRPRVAPGRARRRGSTPRRADQPRRRRAPAPPGHVPETSGFRATSQGYSLSDSADTSAAGASATSPAGVCGALSTVASGRGRGLRRRLDRVQTGAVLAHAPVVGESLDDAVQAGGVDAEPLADLADRDPGTLGDESQHIVVPLTGSRGRRTPRAGPLAAATRRLAPTRRRARSPRAALASAR